MENIHETTESQFEKDVKLIFSQEKESARQVREGFARLGLQIPPQPDNDKPTTLRERLGLK